MERTYREAFAALNSRQRQAVEQIDGPVLVIAGPGTGKTQLISVRVGHILQKTDTPADSILLLTFTEAGVAAIRDRLNLLIGRPAYDIQLSTYHAFGGEIFRRYPDFFEGTELTLLEELGADSLLRSIISKLPYSDPLKFADSYVGDIKSFISESKRALLSPDDLDQIAKDNLNFISKTSRQCSKILNQLAVVSKKSAPIFRDLLANLEYQETDLPSNVLPLNNYASGELKEAMSLFDDTAKTTSLSEWKRRWLALDAAGNYIFDGKRVNQRLKSAANIYRQYQKQLRRQHLYDYDDMIIRAIEALESNSELRYSLADRYSYIMLDEFQDTNRAQFRLVQLLTDHPVHEGRPNVLAVGDDDQAIYAFQGADHANMTSFVGHYKNVKIISLKENYRAWPELLEVGANLANQIQNRLANQFKEVTKNLKAAALELPEPPFIEAREFKTDAAQYNWIATEIRQLIDQGIPASEIAVLAPKHRYLTPLLPYMTQQKLPVRYERRENILDDPLIHQLEQMSRLVVALAAGDERQSNFLWPQVLSYDFWKVPVDKIWQINWQSRSSHEPWTSIALNDDSLKDIAAFFIKLASLVEIAPLELQIDALIGLEKAAKDLKLPLKSPLYDYYFSGQKSQSEPLEFTKLISDLNVLRSRLSDWRQNRTTSSGLRELVEFINGHRAANINILNTSPYHESQDAVNVLTAYGAKGREFQAVFMIAANNQVWGSASRNQGYRLSLPANLSYIRYQGASQDERLRLLYVAATRARTRLYITSYSQDLAGKAASRLKYLDIKEDGSKLKAKILPAKFQNVQVDRSECLSVQGSVNYWTRKHMPPFKPSLQQVLEPRLKAYKLSASDLNHFIDVVNYGPDNFFMRCLLRFPSAPAVTDSFGTAIHNTLRFAGQILTNEGRLPDEARLTDIFMAQLGRIDLSTDQYENLARRGEICLQTWLNQRGADLKAADWYEYDFQNEGSRLSDVPLSGQVDRISINPKRQTITVTDYKTGKAYSKWQNGIIKLHLFQQQLIFYKLLIENSARFRKYKVEKGIIEFVEPDDDGQIKRLELTYDQDQLNRSIKLIQAVWSSIQKLKFSDISGYPPTLAGIKQFETDLITPAATKNTG